MKLSQKSARILEILSAEYPGAGCLLRHDSPFELLVSTILAAQCTDKRVNEVTGTLFKNHDTPRKMSRLKLGKLSELIRTTGFFRTKAANILSVSRILLKKHDGKVPDEMDELIDLPGVGRKTANVVLGNCFGRPAIIVDTHFKRVTGRIGLTASADPEKIEQDISRLLPREKWTAFSHAINHHGRNICKARKPLCSRCAIVNLCVYEAKNLETA